VSSLRFVGVLRFVGPPTFAVSCFPAACFACFAAFAAFAAEVESAVEVEVDVEAEAEVVAGVEGAGGLGVGCAAMLAELVAALAGSVAVADAVGVAEACGVADGLVVASGLFSSLGSMLAHGGAAGFLAGEVDEADAEAVGVGLALGDVVGLTLGFGLVLGEGDEEAGPELPDPLGEIVGVLLADGVGLLAGEAVLDAVAVLAGAAGLTGMHEGPGDGWWLAVVFAVLVPLAAGPPAPFGPGLAAAAPDGLGTPEPTAPPPPDVPPVVCPDSTEELSWTMACRSGGTAAATPAANTAQARARAGRSMT